MSSSSNASIVDFLDDRLAVILSDSCVDIQTLANAGSRLARLRQRAGLYKPHSFINLIELQLIMKFVLAFFALSAVSVSCASLNKRAASLPDPATFQNDKGSKWTIESVGYINATTFHGPPEGGPLGWDKGRTSTIGGKTFWNFGDVSSQGSRFIGFSDGAALYADVNSPLDVVTDGINDLSNVDFAKPIDSDGRPGVADDCNAYGMDTSNIAAIDDNTGIGFVFEIFRSSDPNSNCYKNIVNKGNGIIKVTNGSPQPVATRTGALVSDGSALQFGLHSILAAEGYIYVYSQSGPNGLAVARAQTSQAFDINSYEWLEYDSQTWSKTNGIPAADQTTYGMKTQEGQSGPGIEGCSVYGSSTFNSYLGKYLIFCNAFQSYMK